MGEHWGRRFLWNNGTYLPVYTVSQPRRLTLIISWIFLSSVRNSPLKFAGVSVLEPLLWCSELWEPCWTVHHSRYWASTEEYSLFWFLIFLFLAVVTGVVHSSRTLLNLHDITSQVIVTLSCLVCCTELRNEVTLACKCRCWMGQTWQWLPAVHLNILLAGTRPNWT
jgi:hypothetical protein